MNLKLVALKLLLPIIQGVIEKMITKENYQKYGDKLIDLIEEFVVDSETKVDDALVLPALKLFRKVADIPDFPDDGDHMS